MATTIGSIIEGKYEILTEIGRGGMSCVYLARDTRLNKQWAVKEVKKRATDSNGDVYVQSLITEANMMMNFNHPAFPRIVDIIEKDDVIYIIMDYIEGESLDKVLRAQGPQPYERVVDWGIQLAEALRYLHNQNPPIIYRDLKPANIMYQDVPGVEHGVLKIIDFGTAREYKGSKSSDTVVMLTPGYASPEQKNRTRETDARSDIYCLGRTMHHMLTGQDPTQYNDIISKYKAMKVMLVFCGLGDENIGYNSADLLKKIKENKHAFIFTNIGDHKVFDIPIPFIRQNKKPVDLYQGYYIKENEVLKIRFAKEE